VVAPAAAPAQPAPKEKLPPPTKGEEEAAAGQVATVIIAAPPGARVTINGTPLALKSAEQAFVTPVLEPGAKYSYVVRAEAVRDGRTVATTRKVRVAPGRQVRVDLSGFAAVPAGAGSYVSRD
jgi:uncharacterized protein (TIGR03000 family)